MNSTRRIAVLDIETVSLDPSDPKGALDAISGRIVCIAFLFDDGERLTPEIILEADEKRLLERFWSSIRDTDLLVGHNILAFDLMFIRQRSWILGVKPPLTLNLKKYYTDQVTDLMEMWTNWSSRFKGAGLDNIAQALGCGAKSAHGTDVATWWANRDFNSIARYCMDDVELEYRVYCRMHYREPLGASVLSQPTAPAIAPAAAAVPLPTFRPGDSRQPVMVDRPAFAPAQAKSVATVPSYVPPAGAPAPAAARPSSHNGARRSGGAGKRQDRIVYTEMGGALILGGGTFSLKEQLAALGGRCNKQDDKWVWQVPAAKFNDLAGLCARSNVKLVAA